MASSTTGGHYFFLVALSLLCSAAYGQLSAGYYTTKCSSLDQIVKEEVNRALFTDPPPAGGRRMGASLLRLFFHDCFVQGCDASVLLDDDGTGSFESEKKAGPNANSLDGFHVINRIKDRVEKACPRIVSCADILALAAKQAVVALGPGGQATGSGWPLLLGRRDSRTANMKQANSDLPSPGSDLPTLIAAFDKKKLTKTELVALSGAHTIGMAHCGNVDAAQPQHKCSNVDSSVLVPLDEQTPGNFDNLYYKNLLSNRGLLRSDRVLTSSDDVIIRNLVWKYAYNQTLFFQDFGKAMKRMSELNVLTGTNGEIRRNCSRVN